MDLTDFSPNDRILHYPCGDGSLCRKIAALVPLGVAIGLDADDAVRAARAASLDVDNVMFIPCDGHEIPWKEDFFSHVIVGNQELPLREIVRVLAEGGRAFLETGELIATKEHPTTPAGPAGPPGLKVLR
jgi:ubiquinone/menaquinone biosynthesis C-methylase UbiE